MNDTLSILQRNLGQYKKTSQGEYLFKCPNCNHHKSKLQVDINKGWYHCWVCDYSAKSTYNFIKKFFPSALPSLPKKKSKYKSVFKTCHL